MNTPLSKVIRTTQEQAERWVFECMKKFKRPPPEHFQQSVVKELQNFSSNTAWTIINDVYKRHDTFPPLSVLRAELKKLEPIDKIAVARNSSGCSHCKDDGIFLMVKANGAAAAVACDKCSKGGVYGMRHGVWRRDVAVKAGYTLEQREFTKRRHEERHGK